MTKLMKGLLGLVTASLVATGCEVFEDQTPEFINVSMDGTPGQAVTVIYSKQFVAGVNEQGVTRVEVFGSDTVQHTLPFDTIIDVNLERRLFLRAEPPTTDTLDIDVHIDVDGRQLFDGAGKVYPLDPWLFLYQFNSRFTDDIQVVI